MGIHIPQNFSEFYPFLAAVLTLWIGMFYFLFPRVTLNRFGIEGALAHPEAIGEGRSSFAGLLVGTSLVVILFQQPVLNAMLGFGWGIAAVGKLAQILIDGRRSLLAYLRLAGAVGLSWLAFDAAGGPAVLVDPDAAFGFPEGLTGWLALISALVTTVFGLLCFFLPQVAMSAMRLKRRESDTEDFTGASGELRGTLAGFYLALGGLALLFGLMNYPLFSQTMIYLALGFCWCLTAFGRMISMLSDGGNNWFNWLSLLLELSLAALPLLVVFGLLN